MIKLSSIYVLYSILVIYLYYNLGKIRILLKPGDLKYVKNQKYILIITRVILIAFIVTYLYTKTYSYISLFYFATGLLLSTPMLSIGFYYEIIREESITEKGFGFFTNNLYDESLIMPEKIYKYFLVRIALWITGFNLILKSIILQ